jgi:hypothetical protein
VVVLGAGHLASLPPKESGPVSGAARSGDNDVPLMRDRCFWFRVFWSSKKSPGHKRGKSGAAKPEFSNGYLVVFIFEPLWLLADMYILL